MHVSAQHVDACRCVPKNVHRPAICTCQGQEGGRDIRHGGLGVQDGACWYARAAHEEGDAQLLFIEELLACYWREARAATAAAASGCNGGGGSTHPGLLQPTSAYSPPIRDALLAHPTLAPPLTHPSTLRPANPLLHAAARAPLTSPCCPNWNPLSDMKMM